MNSRDLLEKQIIDDANNGDTTVLAELLERLSDEEIFNALSDENQEKVNENRFICEKCGEFFPREEMVFDNDYDCDLCKGCNSAIQHNSFMTGGK